MSSAVFGQGLTNGTNLYIESGVVLNVDNHFDNRPSGTIHNASEVRVSGNFNNSGTAEIDELVVLDGAGAQSVTGLSRFYGVLEVEKPSGTATVTSGTTNVHGILRLDDGTMNANGNLVIASTVSETGLVDDFSDPSLDGVLSGNLRVQRYIGQEPGFHYVGSAVNNCNLLELSEFNLYGPDGWPVIPLPSCSPTAIDGSSPYGSMFEWHEEGPWIVPGCDQSGWFIRSSGIMQNARGYAVITANQLDFTFETAGNVGNTSEFSTVSYSGLTNSGTPEGDGWHLVSNPFPSPIRWSAPPAGFDGQAQFWETTGSFYGTYQPVLPPMNALIASQQGFFVRVSGGPASFALPQSYRDLGDPYFYKEDLSNTFDIIVEAGGFADKTRVRFGQDFTNGFDSMDDANKLKAPGAQPTLQTRLRNTKYSINSLSLEDYPMTVPMDLIPGISGEFKFTAKHLDQFNVEAHVYLEDLKTKIIQELTVNPVYTFNADESDDPERFLLHFRLGPDAEPMYTGDEILLYAYDRNAIIFLPELDGKAQLEVFDAIGNLVFQTSNLNEGKNEIDLNNLATGTYILRALVNEKPVTKKVVL
ncbi:MAG: T9SS type A sorting domain-containing protein [Flavobacteriales bacterium]|nr:T9SS type A sorting domain-containing protein [Flavobacteriales bacterium]